MTRSHGVLCAGDASLVFFAPGGAAKTCCTPGTAAFWPLPRGEKNSRESPRWVASQAARSSLMFMPAHSVESLAQTDAAYTLAKDTIILEGMPQGQRPVFANNTLVCG